MLNSNPVKSVLVDSYPIPVSVPLTLTPAEWLAMLPAVVAQLEPSQHEEFVTQILRACDRAGVELAGCVLTEFEAARWWR